MDRIALTPNPEGTAEDTGTQRQAPSAAAFYIDADNQSPTLAGDLMASVCDDWGLDVSRVVLAGNDHGQSLARWQAALSERLSENCVLRREVPRTPEAADLALILELGAAMGRHRQQQDLLIIVSRDDWLIAAAEAVRQRGCRVWVAYAQTETAPARTRLSTLLLPAVNHTADSNRPKPPADEPSATGAAIAAPRLQVQGTSAAPQQVQAPNTQLLAQLRAQCTQQPGGGYHSSEVGQVLYRLGLTTKGQRERFLRTVPGLREVGTGTNKRLLF